MTYIISTHEIDYVPAIADWVYVLGGRHGIVLSGPPEHVFSQPGALRDAGIEPPALTELFESLKKRGWDVSVPLTVDQAIEELDSARAR